VDKRIHSIKFVGIYFLKRLGQPNGVTIKPNAWHRIDLSSLGDDFMALFYGQLDEVRADEPGCSRDQYF
jgi:hypothetical protein